MKNKLVDLLNIETKIFVIRGHKVMLDSDLAELYHVELRALIQAVKRNIHRFPNDFMFQLSDEEHVNLRSQIVISSFHGGRRYLPFVFNQDGVAMLSSVLRSRRAVMVNIQIMRTFNKMREVLLSYKDLQKKIMEMEAKYDQSFAVVFQELQKLLDGPEKPVHIKGFKRKGTN